MSSSSRLAFGLLVLAAVACGVNSPPAEPDTSPKSATTRAQQPAPGVVPEEPAPAPEEPAWPTAAGLSYREVVLGGADPEQPLPMIVAIHGLGDEPDNFRHLLDGFTEPARLILPRGLEPSPEGGWSWFAIRARSPDVDGLARGIGNAADRIAEAIRALEQSRPTLGKPIVTGFSQGGMLTFALAVRHPDLVGYAIALGGWLPPPLMPDPPPRGSASGVQYPRLVALHGTADAAVPFPPTEQAVKDLEARGMKIELLEYEGVGHMIPDLMRRDLYERLTEAVAQAGHPPR